MIRFHDNITASMGTLVKSYSHFHIVWYTIKLDTGKEVNRRAEDLRLASTPAQYGVSETAYEPVIHLERTV